MYICGDIDSTTYITVIHIESVRKELVSGHQSSLKFFSVKLASTLGHTQFAHHLLVKIQKMCIDQRLHLQEGTNRQ